MRNVIQFPETKDKKLSTAISIFWDHTADSALEAFKRLVDEGYDEAFAFIGAIYEFGGKNVARDYAKAKFYYEQSIERFGAVEAYLGLIRIHYYGLGVERDCCKALEYCTLLSEEANHPLANVYIGRIYMEGCCVDKDIEKSKEFFKKAWKRGYVFGLTYLGIAEQKSGHRLLGWLHRIKAGILAFRISRMNINDDRIREL
ncbi:tetratricopeptide repeat protein [Methylohalobius crimeensis]|uniref:tetratricopeptide repeat protein n=1 Tax=Methylohalobius crimeensis TaxID=244365 RepID=UPI0003B5B7CE|nr:tetratricopeptide repeat protein [Methylohalobius crimeensis]